MGFWNTLGSGGPPPGAPGGPPRQLTLPRLMNLLVNPFAVATQRSFQKDVYQYPWSGPVATLAGQFRDPFPIWIGCDIALGAYKTQRGMFPIPDNFYLLGMFASSTSNVQGGFKVSLYDTNRRVNLTVRPVNFNAYAGTGNSPLFLRVPYPVSIAGGEVKLRWTIVSLEKVATSVQFGLYGTQVSNTAPPSPSLAQRVAAALHP